MFTAALYVEEARAAGRRGTLPTVAPEESWVGASPGGKACFICELPIAAGDIECDVDLAGTLPIQVHRRCCDILLRTLRDGTSGRRPSP
jgi:hypothetical protein